MQLRNHPYVNYAEERIDDTKPSKSKYTHKPSFVTKTQLRNELLLAKNHIADLQSKLESTKDMVSSHFATVARRNKITEDELKNTNKAIETFKEQKKTFERTIRMQKAIIADRNIKIANLKKHLQIYLIFEIERHEN